MKQKDEEKLVLERFRKYCDEFPQGKVIAGESPDFIVRSGPHKQTGIELTRMPLKKSDIVSDLKAAIENKNEKLRQYRDMKLNEIWLLIYSDNLSGTFNGNLPTRITNLRVESAYSAIYLIDLFKNKSYRLTIT